MPQGGYIVADYEAILRRLNLEMSGQKPASVLVVLVIAHGHAKFVQEVMMPYVGYWHFRSGDALHFFFVGYADPAGDTRSAASGEDCHFDDRAFVATVERLETLSDWRYSGNASVLICCAHRAANRDESRAALDLTGKVEFDLERAAKEHVVDTIPAFFETLIRFAKVHRSDGDSWRLSDVVEGKMVANALVDWVWEHLPKGTKRVVKALDYFRVK